jgi:hypothetical protein
MDNITLVCIMGVGKKLFDLNLIKPFVEHYRAMGIEKFFITINAEVEDDIVDGLKILRDLGIEPTVWIGEFSEFSKTDNIRKLQKSVTTEWTFVVDSDEFVQIDDLDTIIDKCNKSGYSAVRGVFVDRVSLSGALEAVDPKSSIWEQFPVEADVMGMVGGYRDKSFLFKTGRYMSGYGNHSLYIIDKPNRYGRRSNKAGDSVYYPVRYNVAHFKWTSTCPERLKARVISFETNSTRQFLNELKTVSDNIADGNINLSGFDKSAFKGKVDVMEKPETQFSLYAKKAEDVKKKDVSEIAKS